MQTANPAHDPALTTRSAAPEVRRSSAASFPVLEAGPDGPPAEIAETLDRRRPAAVYAITALLGYLCLIGAAIGLGALLTQVILTGNGLSADDEHVSSWFARQQRHWADAFDRLEAVVAAETPKRRKS